MKLSVKALTLGVAILWGGMVLFTGVINLLSPGYGAEFLKLVASLYPGYDAAPGMGRVVIATAYALADGAVTGALFAWLYNSFAR